MIARLLKISLTCLAIALSLTATAQLGDTHWWGNYTYNQSVKQHWQLSSRLEMRYLDFENNFYRAGISPKLQYQGQKNLKYIIGSRFFLYNTETKDGAVEYRPWIGLSYGKPTLQNMYTSHQVRWEHRLYGEGGSAYESRIRYKFKIGTTLYERNERSLKVAFAPELFWSFNDWDEGSYKNTRWGIPVSYRYSEKLVMEVVPFLQTNHDGFLSVLDDRFGVIQLNLKTFL